MGARLNSSTRLVALLIGAVALGGLAVAFWWGSAAPPAPPNAAPSSPHEAEAAQLEGAGQRGELTVAPGRTLALNLAQVSALELELAADLPAPVSISEVAAWPRPGTEAGARLHTLEPALKVTLPMAEGARTVFLHNPGRRPLRVRASREGQGPIAPPAPVLLQAVAVGPGQPPVRFAAVEGQGAMRLDVWAMLDEVGDSQPLDFTVELIGDKQKMLATQRTWLTPTPSRFETVGLPSAATGSSIAHTLSRPWQGVVVLSEGARYVQLSADSRFLVRALVADRLSRRDPMTPKVAATRRWRYRSSSGVQEAVVPEDRPGLLAAGRVIPVRAQARLEPTPTGRSGDVPPGPAWSPLKTVEAEANQALLIPSPAQVPAGQPLWMRCVTGGDASMVLPVDPASPSSGYLDAIVALPGQARPGAHVRVTMAGVSAIDAAIEGPQSTFQVGGLSRRGALKWTLQGGPRESILLLRAGPGSQPGQGCQVLTNMRAMWLAPGRSGALRFEVPAREVTGLNLLVHGREAIGLQWQVDEGRPLRRPGLAFGRYTRATTDMSIRARADGLRAWVVHRPMSAVRETERIFVPLRDDLRPGLHLLNVTNRGEGPIWVRGFQRRQTALD